MDERNDFVEVEELHDYPEQSCSKVSYQHADVNVPVEIKPNATVGKIELECCGEPVITSKESYHDACEILISQKICVKIPVRYHVSTKVGDSFVDCKGPGCCN